MLYAVLFEDNAEKATERPRLMPEHQAFLRKNADRIRNAGPLIETNGSAAGGLWVVDAANGNEVQELVEQDPLWPTGLRKSVRVLEWKRVFNSSKSFL